MFYEGSLFRRYQAISDGEKWYQQNVSLLKVNYLECREKIILTISEERKKRVIDFYYYQGKTRREIAKIERISIRDISPILKEEEAKLQRHKVQQQQEETSSKAYELFSKGKKPVEVSITLNLREQDVTKLFTEYCKLKRLHILNSIYRETKGKLGPFLKLYKELIKQKGMSIENVVNAIDIAIHKLPYMESLYKQQKDEINKLQNTIEGLLKNIEALKYKISILDKTAITCEQDCKRTEQQLQELIDKKNRIENMIANVLNSDNERYSKLKQLVKENVKATLSENKKLIVVSFAALIQTLRADSQMINIIYKILTANGSEQDKDNDNSIIKYLESIRIA